MNLASFMNTANRTNLGRSAAVFACTAATVCAMGLGCLTTHAMAATSGQSESTETAATTSTQATETRTVTDLSGTVVEIPAEVTSIAATYPAAEEIFLMVGADDINVSVSSSNLDNEWMQVLYPELAEKPQLFPSMEVDAEALLKASPDVVVCHSEALAEQVRALGIPAVYAMGTSPETLIDTIELVGEIVGGDAGEKAEKLVAYYKDNMAQATERTDKLTDGECTRVYYATGSGPLNTEGNGSIVTDWIEMAGGVNVSAENGVDGMFVDIDMEDLLAWDPEVIVTCTPEVAQEFMTDKRFANVTAVKNGAVYASPEGAFTWCVRSADEALMTLWAATVIQPDLFSDIDYAEVVKDFYEEFYGYTPSDEEVEGILNPQVQE